MCNPEASARFAPQASLVIPAKAGIQGRKGQRTRLWIPAFAGMTQEGAKMTEEEEGDHARP